MRLRLSRLSVLPLVALLFPGATGSLSAQDGATIAGQVDSSLTAMYSTLPPSPEPWSLLGMSRGVARISYAGNNLRSDIRLAPSTWPEPGITLERLWARVKDGNLALSAGLTRLDWGPGLVFNVANVLFDNRGGSPVLGAGAGEVYGNTAFLVDLWYGLGAESFLEFALRAPDPTTGQPPLLSDAALAARFSAAPGGVLLEGNLMLDGQENVLAASLSTQWNLLADWYGSLAASLPVDDLSAGELVFKGNAGAFLLYRFDDGHSLSLRNEALFAWENLQSYHDLSLSTPDDLTLALRALVDYQEAQTLAMAELNWLWLYGAKVYLRGQAYLGKEGLDATKPASITLGLVTRL